MIMAVAGQVCSRAQTFTFWFPERVCERGKVWFTREGQADKDKDLGFAWFALRVEY